MSIKETIRLFVVFLVAHLIAYLLAGAIAISFFYKGFWDGPDPLYQPFLRTMVEPELWRHTEIWQIPGQIIRAILMALALLPVAAKLKEMTVGSRYLFFFSLLFIFTHLAAAAPSPANVEGFIYMRPEFVQPAFWRGQAEMILYSLVAGFLIARFVFKIQRKTKGD